MPTYRNKLRESVIINNSIFPFNEEKEVEFYINEADYPQLIKISDDPIYSPIVYSERCSGNCQLLDKITSQVSSIRIISLSTISSIIFNDDNNSEVFLTQNTPLELKNPMCYKSITVTSGEVAIELWKGFKWN